MSASASTTISANPNYGATAGLPELQEAICEYLTHSRAVSCRPDQIIIVHGSQQALELVVRATVDPGTEVALADPAVMTGQILWSEDVLHPELGTRGWLRD